MTSPPFSPFCLSRFGKNNLFSSLLPPEVMFESLSLSRVDFSDPTLALLASYSIVQKQKCWQPLHEIARRQLTLNEWLALAQPMRSRDSESVSVHMSPIPSLSPPCHHCSDPCAYSFLLSYLRKLCSGWETSSTWCPTEVSEPPSLGDRRSQRQLQI